MHGGGAMGQPGYQTTVVFAVADRKSRHVPGGGWTTAGGVTHPHSLPVHEDVDGDVRKRVT